MTDEQIESERLAFERFHSLRKSNSSRRERQAAWAVVNAILMRRRAQAFRAHPLQPAARWIDFDGTSPDGWTYPGLRSLEPAEIDEMFPGALAAHATQCDDIAESRFVFDQWSGGGGRLRLSIPMRFGMHGSNATWLPEVGIWRRYCQHVSCKPYVGRVVVATPSPDRDTQPT